MFTDFWLRPSFGAIKKGQSTSWLRGKMAKTETLKLSEVQILTFQLWKLHVYDIQYIKVIYDQASRQVGKVAKLSLTRPLRKKLRMRWFFDVSKVKDSSFFKSDLTDPPQIFNAHLLENTDLSPSRFHFSVVFILRSCFESDGFIDYSNEWD